MLWWRAVNTIETVFFGQFKMEYQSLAKKNFCNPLQGLVRSLLRLPFCASSSSSFSFQLRIHRSAPTIDDDRDPLSFLSRRSRLRHPSRTPSFHSATSPDDDEHRQHQTHVHKSSADCCHLSTPDKLQRNNTPQILMTPKLARLRMF